MHLNKHGLFLMNTNTAANEQRKAAERAKQAKLDKLSDKIFKKQYEREGRRLS